MNYFCSDTHFCHASIIIYTNRPFKSAGHMDEVLIDNWNSVVKPNDTVYFLGDLCLRNKAEYYTNRLNGKIIWIKGNHDDRSDTILEKCIINYGGIDWQLVHRPEDADDKYKHILCGHVHGLWKIKRVGDRTFVNCGVDVWNFKPISIKQILKAIDGE